MFKLHRLFRTKNKLKKYEYICKHHDYCYIKLSKKESILKYNNGENSMKVPFIIYADMESLLEKIALVIIILKSH